MNLTDLNSDESLALIGLVAQMVSADGEMSEQEMAELGHLGAEMGQDAFSTAFETQKARFQSLDDAVEFAGTIENQDAREIIHTCLVDMAQSDGLVEAEASLIRRIALMWGIRSRAT
jgi:uncharacterized tellurite resistance protein B-like protein